MEIKLTINEEEKIFKAPPIALKKLDNAFALSDKINDGLSMRGLFQELLDFTIDIYGEQFTKEELLNGFYPADEFMSKALEDLSKVSGTFEEKVKKLSDGEGTENNSNKENKYLSPRDFIKDLYSMFLFEKNWSMVDIDNMDIFYYLDILAYMKKNKSDKNNPNENDVYIDQLSWL
ncbi:hypothetical protein I6A73_11585 [Clostridioides difficile]|nr:hypothetical protein [Clostridioides difficile]